MAGLSLEIVPGWVFTPEELITIEKLNKLVNELTINLLGVVGSAQIGAQSVYTSNLKDGCLSADDEGRAKMADGYLLARHVDPSVILGGAPSGFRNLKAVASGAGVTVTADEVTVRKTAGGAAYKAGFNASADLNVGIGNLNGLDIAPMPVTGWMYVYVVSNGTDFQTQISTSGTGPSPAAGTAAGYAYWALVGAFYKSAGAAWRAATQVGQRVFYAGEQTTIALSSLVASTGGAAINLTTYLPPSANMALGNVGMVTVSSTSQGVSLALNSTGLGLQYFCGVGLAATTFGGAAAQWAYRVPVLGTAALFYKTATNSGNYRLSVTGYEY